MTVEERAEKLQRDIEQLRRQFDEAIAERNETIRRLQAELQKARGLE